MSGGQGKTLQDFAPFTPAEEKLIAWLQAGSRKFLTLSQNVPDVSSDAVTLRATFIRYLALGGCDACRLPETGLQVAGAYIEGDERNSESTNGLDLEGASLPHDLALFDCHIPDPIILRSAKIKNLLLNESDVKAEFTADRLQAEGDVFLRGATIAGEVRLLGARLGGALDCVGAELQSKSDALSCDGMQAEGNVFLHRATIAGEVRLSGARLEGDLECDGAELQAKGKALSCDGAKITGTFFWRTGAKTSGCIDLTAASIGAINDDPNYWPPELILYRCRYDAFQGNNAPTDAKSRLKWLALQKPLNYGHDFWPDPYEHCAKVLREMGHGADARKILIEKERLQRKARRDRLRRDGQTPFANLLAVSDWLMGITTRYGRQPLLAFAWLLFFWGFGALWFDEAYTRGEIKPNLPQVQLSEAWHGCAETGARREPEHTHQPACFAAQPEGASYPRFNAFFYSADTLFPVVSLEMQSYWIPDDTQPFGKWARGYLWFHIAMGWALTLLAVAGFSGLIKTDNTT